jgi:DNA relaxase NicK
MAEFMYQDVHQVAAFIHECLMARLVRVDPAVDFNAWLLYEFW